MLPAGSLPVVARRQMNAALRICWAWGFVLMRTARNPERGVHLPPQGRKAFFSEEKKQKTFANSGVCAA
jgi:hypothetical protein